MLRLVWFAREIDKSKIESISLVSVSFDTSRKVFEETIKRDGLNTATQFYDKDGSQSDIFDNYRLNKGFASYLISPEGVIIAKDRTIDKTYSSIIKTSVM